MPDVRVGGSRRGRMGPIDVCGGSGRPRHAVGQKKEKSAKPELVVKKTLEVKGKETKIVSTIKKGGATSKKAQSKKIKKMPKSVESSGNLAKKRVNPKKVVSKRKSPFKIPEAEEKVVISKK